MAYQPVKFIDLSGTLYKIRDLAEFAELRYTKRLGSFNALAAKTHDVVVKPGYILDFNDEQYYVRKVNKEHRKIDLTLESEHSKLLYMDKDIDVTDESIAYAMQQVLSDTDYNVGFVDNNVDIYNYKITDNIVAILNNLADINRTVVEYDGNTINLVVRKTEDQARTDVAFHEKYNLEVLDSEIDGQNIITEVQIIGSEGSVLYSNDDFTYYENEEIGRAHV